VRATILLLLSATLLPASETDALAISANIQARHLPFGTVLDPITSTPTSEAVVGYTRCGDSALWSGAYLAAESFRYRVTRSPDALRNVKAALAGLKALADVTGDNRLARCMVLASSPYAPGIASEEAQHGIHSNPPWIWVGNTSRDQVVGVFFGLGVAYDMVADDSVRAAASELATRLIGYISRHQWSPDDDITSTFRVRPEGLQMLLEVARHLNPGNTVSGPIFMPPMSAGVVVDVQSNESYFKFNLDYMSFFHLVALRNQPEDRDAYRIVRSHTASHQNAFFNLIDRALSGADATRDAETGALLEQWLERPRRDFYVDLSRTVPVCFGGACSPVPVPLRPPTDFLWQRNPFQLAGGGSGVIESPGVDYILPYWMARYYGVIPAPVQPSAAAGPAVAPGSLASLYGARLAAATARAVAQPLPLALGGVSLAVTDAAGVRRDAALLFVSPAQINFVVPQGMAPGPAIFSLAPAGLPAQTFTAAVDAVAPALFTMTGTGTGVAAATAFVARDADPLIRTDVRVFSCAASACSTLPIPVTAGSTVYVTLYGTGIRNRGSLSAVSARLHGVTVPVLYAGPAAGFDGLDQVNVALTINVRGAGESDFVLTVDGRESNPVKLNVQ
jgi:uncharacterized protein (TIGR03437 family)